MMQRPYRFIILIIAFSAAFSCTVVKKYNPDEAFIFENSIKIQGNIDKDQKADLKSRLERQIEDSARVFDVSTIPWPKFPWIIPVPVIKNPTRLDTLAIVQSSLNMRNLMTSIGYRDSRVTADTSLSRHKKEQRIKVSYSIDPGRLFILDTINYKMNDSALQELVMKNLSKSHLHKGDPFTYSAVDQELNQIAELMQVNGYVNFRRDDLIAEADTGYRELIDPTLDPFEYIQRLAEAEEKRKHPRVGLYIRLNAIRDSSHFQKYTVGTFRIYPDAPVNEALQADPKQVDTVNGFQFVSLYNTFDPYFITQQVELKPGMIYDRDKYSQTLNNFNRLGAWQNINIFSRTEDSTKKVNYLLRLSPAKKQYFSVDLEGSSLINSSQINQVGSGKVGLAVNFTLKNRNLAKKAIQLENNLRTGIEFNNFEKILSGEVSLINRLTIPWIVVPFTRPYQIKAQSGKTIVSADFSYIDRFQYYLLRSFNTFIGYEWKPRPATTIQVRPINFEFTRFDPDSLFLESIKDNPLLVYTYNDGLIIGLNFSYTRNLNPASKRHINLIKIYAEESGLVSGLVFKDLTAEGKALANLYRFVKMDVDFRHIISYKKSSLHMRAFAGYGYALQTESKEGAVTLPFFKSYFAGGPNSMRGWQIRKLGIGSNIYFDTVLNGTLNDKYADAQLEANLEYRFNLFQFFGFWMRGAVFTDVGNIWYRNDLDGTLPRADLNFARFYKDLAVASGFGARLDFKYFLLRFDLGFPLKDPRYGPYNTGDPKADEFYSPKKYSWFVEDVWNKPTFQFAIGYPF
jgi:outer membrane protein assembly factor BamA